jgi:hypothetical protein
MKEADTKSRLKSPMAPMKQKRLSKWYVLFMIYIMKEHVLTA